MSSRIRTGVGLVVVGAALTYLLGSGIGDNLVYFLTPSELLGQGEAAVNVPYRLSGRVEAGSVEWDAEALELRFRIEDDESVVPVVSSNTPPQMFHDGIDVVVEGRLGTDGIFQAHTLMVKHSNEYAPPEEHPSDRFPELPTNGDIP